MPKERSVTIIRRALIFSLIKFFVFLLDFNFFNLFNLPLYGATPVKVLIWANKPHGVTQKSVFF